MTRDLLDKVRKYVISICDLGELTPMCSISSITYVFPGPQAVGQVLGVQNSHTALENKLICWKNATAERNQ